MNYVHRGSPTQTPILILTSSPFQIVVAAQLRRITRSTLPTLGAACKQQPRSIQIPSPYPQVHVECTPFRFACRTLAMLAGCPLVSLGPISGTIARAGPKPRLQRNPTPLEWDPRCLDTPVHTLWERPAAHASHGHVILYSHH